MIKKLILVSLIIVIFITGCSFKGLNNKKTEDGKIIGTSNDTSNKLQIKILNEYINIRKEQSVDSEILGVVKKGSYFDVIDYEKVDEYFWVHIKTNNNIEGYVASFDDNIYYEFVNGDVDFISPKLDVKVDVIEVNSYNDLTDEYINSIVRYSDDKDKNPEFNFEITSDDINHYINFKVIDKSNNFVEDKIKLVVKNERLASNGNWLTFEEVRELRNKFINIARKYGNADTYITITNSYWRIDFSHITTIQVFTDMSWFYGCSFTAKNNEIEINRCNDAAGEISYDQMKNKIASQEKSAKNAYLKIKEEFEKTGYKIEDLSINFN